MVFYRKYRPQRIEDLDSEAVRNALYSIFAKNNFPHAFLFSGPKGLGKTSAARIVAKVINCQKHQNIKGIKTEKEIEPCNKCLECTSITNGTNFDVLEIDGASNRGIDEIRDLKEKINLLPSGASKKIYIIDEVHMLTTEAFNALLKTLEEPPAHVVFILCTTEFHKLPQTIVSRCFRVDFTRATDVEIARSLNRIVKSEDLKIDKDVIEEIAKMSDGSFRDATKILEELTTAAGRKIITKAILEEKYNTLGMDKALNEFILALESKDTKKGFGITSKLIESGADFKYFLEKLMERIHVLLLAKVGVGESSENSFTVEDLKRLLELLGKAYQETKYSVLPSLPLELALVEWESWHAVGLRSQPAEIAPKESSATSAVQISPVAKPKITISDFSSEFINEVKNHNHLIAGVLRSCEIENSKEGAVEITAISKFHKDKLLESKSMIILEEVAEKLSGKKLTVNVTLRG